MLSATFHDSIGLLLAETAKALLSPGSTLSLWALLSAFGIAAGTLIARRKGRPLAISTLLRAMLPRDRLFGRSGRADIAFTILSVLFSGLLFGWAILSYQLVATDFRTALRVLTGAHAAHAAPAWLATSAMTLALFVAYEFAYWLNHMMSHKLPFLWRFHQVHHSAESLSPLTIFRVHPVDTILFYNTVALATGIAGGAVAFALGDNAQPLAIGGTNILLVAAIMTVKNLQHSHVWIAFSGPLGRLLLSPAHHQIHHSDAPEHFDRNFGATLAIFDWAFGTLHLPKSRRERIAFGVNGLQYDPHNVAEALVAPVAEALGSLGLERLGPPRRALDAEHPSRIFGR